MSDRLIDPFDIVRGNAQRRAGVPDAREERLDLLRAQRYDDTPVLEGIAIGWETPNQGADQTISTTTYALITGATFPLSLPGADDAIWLVQFTYRVIVSSTGATDTDVFARGLINWGDGTFREPDIDLTGIHGAVSAFGPVDYAESAATGVAFSLKPGAVLKVRGGSSIEIGVGVRVGSSQTAVIQANSVGLNPHCFGTATPYRRVR